MGAGFTGQSQTRGRPFHGRALRVDASGAGVGTAGEIDDRAVAVVAQLGERAAWRTGVIKPSLREVSPRQGADRIASIAKLYMKPDIATHPRQAVEHSNAGLGLFVG